MELVLKSTKVLVALQLDHFLLQAIAHMRVAPVSMLMPVLLSWRYFQHWGALSVRMQQLCSSGVRYIKELFSSSSLFLLLFLFHSSVRSQAAANSSPLSKYNLQKSASGFKLYPSCTSISEMARNTIPAASLGSTIPAGTLWG